MKGNVNCKFNDKGNGCKHPKVEKGLFGLGKRRCVKYGDHSAECLYYNPYPRPTSPEPVKKKAGIEEGVCPKCGELLVYIRGPVTNDTADVEVYWEVKCVDCGFEGKEWYDLKFTEFEEVTEH